MSIELIKKLRKATQAKMQDCKNALDEAQGDIDKALEILQKLIKNRAAKFVDRVATEGRLVSASNNSFLAVLEITCQTDFVSRSDDFVDFANQVVTIAAKNKIETIDSLLKQNYKNEVSIKDALDTLSGTIGEKIELRNLNTFNDDNTKSVYIHNTYKLAAVVTLDGGNENIARDLAMHATAFNPTYKDSSSIPSEIIEKERAKYFEELANSGKPKEILDKIVDGKMQKLFLAETCFIYQAFVKDNNITVKEYLEQNKATMLNFIRFELGAGIEKKQENFADEVNKQINQASSSK